MKRILSRLSNPAEAVSAGITGLSPGARQALTDQVRAISTDFHQRASRHEEHTAFFLPPVTADNSKALKEAKAFLARFTTTDTSTLDAATVQALMEQLGL